MGLNKDIQDIRKVGGSVSVDGTPCGSEAELNRLLAATENGKGILHLIKLNIKSIAETVRLNEALPLISRPGDYPIGYRPVLDIRPDQEHIFNLDWR